MTSTNAGEWRDIYVESCELSTRTVGRLRAELAEQDRARRINAAVAVRYGAPKTRVADTLNVSRPTLDAWLSTVDTTPTELDEVEEIVSRNARLAERKASKAR